MRTIEKIISGMNSEDGKPQNLTDNTSGIPIFDSWLKKSG